MQPSADIKCVIPSEHPNHKAASTTQWMRFKEVQNKRLTPVKYLANICALLLFFSSWADKWLSPQFYYRTVNLWLHLLCLLYFTSDVDKHPAIISRLVTQYFESCYQRFQRDMPLCCDKNQSCFCVSWGTLGDHNTGTVKNIPLTGTQTASLFKNLQTNEDFCMSQILKRICRLRE